MGRYVGNKWHEELPSSGPADQTQGNNVPVPSSGGGGGGAAAPAVAAAAPQPSASNKPVGKNAYGDDIYNTPNGQKTGTQITQELAAAGWDGKGDPVTVYNQTSGGSGSTPGTPGAPAATGTDADIQKLQAGIQSLLNAQASGNKDAVAEAIREFNATFGLDTQKFQDDVRRFNQNFEISQAGLTGMYQGAPTLQAQNQAYTQQMGVINAASALQANPFRQAQVIGQAGRVLQGLPAASFAAPNTVAGVGTVGGNTQGGMGYLSQLISDIKDPTANMTTAQSWLDATPTPNKIDSTSFLRSTPTTQNLILQSMQEKYGLDPQDSLKQIQATLPQFSAPNTTGVIRRG
jgi:hypothetical protein